MRYLSKADRERFKELAALEPELNVLLKEAQRIKRQSPKTKLLCGLMIFCAQGCWAGACPGGKRPAYETTFAGRLDKLVGWHRQEGPEELKTSEAYDIANAMIYWALPPCNMPPCNIPRGYPDWDEVIQRYADRGEELPF